MMRVEHLERLFPESTKQWQTRYGANMYVTASRAAVNNFVRGASIPKTINATR